MEKQLLTKEQEHVDHIGKLIRTHIYMATEHKTCNATDTWRKISEIFQQTPHQTIPNLIPKTQQEKTEKEQYVNKIKHYRDSSSHRKTHPRQIPSNRCVKATT